ncbi:MAG: LacI family DNA-binding transcriptional regulator [Ruaniaceae bacterium]|nr:LacI family DNA-binding transcriptional regulator [Ruaniaceae bacterium]
MTVQARSGRGRPSIYDVATLAGVSHQTVSRVINGHANVRDSTRARVVRAMEEIDYTPSPAARALATSRSRRIGVIVDGPMYYGPSSTLWGVEDAAREAGYSVASVAAAYNAPHNFSTAYEHLRAQEVDALCVIAPRYTRADLGAADLPTIFVGAEPQEGAVAAAVDQYAGALLAVDHLLELGHRQIVHVAGLQDWADGRVRTRAYADRMAEVGQTPYVVFGDWRADFGYELGQRLDFPGHASAIFAGNDQMALGLLHAFHERGIRVPQDISIVAFDDIPEARHFFPPLTTVRQDFHALGTLAVRALIKKLEGEADTHTEMIAPKLMIRESTAPPK